MSDQPPPAPLANGYQPAPGEGITHLDIEVAPSFEYQSAPLRGRVEFPSPRSPAEINEAYDAYYEHLKGLAKAKVNDLVVEKRAAEQRVKQQAGQQAQQAATQAAQSGGQQAPQQNQGQQQGGSPWEIGTKPNNKGTFKYLPTSVFSKDDFLAAAEQLAQAEGIDTDQTIIWDDRTGNYGLESGKNQYAAGKIKAKDDTVYKASLGGRSLGYLDFNEDSGELELYVTKDGKAAIEQAQAASQVTQPQAPPPSEADVPF